MYASLVVSLFKANRKIDLGTAACDRPRFPCVTPGCGDTKTSHATKDVLQNSSRYQMVLDSACKLRSSPQLERICR